MEISYNKKPNEDIGAIEYDIEIFNLTKKYPLKKKNKEITALNNINLKVKKGETFGLLGPNGAGKTTMVSILTTLLQPTSGYAKILGHNILKEPWFVKENVGLMLGGEMIYHRLTGYKNLKFYCKIYDIKNYKKKINDMAELFNLTRWMDEYVDKYSRGMRLKLALSRILLIDPKILFLDEPMLGLDPISIEQLISILKDLRKTIFLTSHQMQIVQKLCDRIAFLKEGNILKIDTHENFKKLILDKVYINVKAPENKKKLTNGLNKMDFVSEIKVDNDEVFFYIQNENNYHQLFDFLKDFKITNFNHIQPSLDDVFIKLSK